VPAARSRSPFVDFAPAPRGGPEGSGRADGLGRAEDPGRWEAAGRDFAVPAQAPAGDDPAPADEPVADAVGVPVIDHGPGLLRRPPTPDG
jgi:hypothetical protein